MLNIVKSVNYGLRKDTGVIISIVAMLGFPFFIIALISNMDAEGLKSVTASFLVGSQLLGMVYGFSYLGIIIISCKAMGMDGSDKTINYEIMSGHRRFKVFAGRVISGIVWGVILVLIIDSLPVLVFCLANGWGKETDPFDVIIRMLLCFFPMLRLCAFHMMIASLLGSAGKGIAAGLGVFTALDIIESVMAENFNLQTDNMFGFINILSLLIPQNSREFIVDGKPVTIFDTSIDSHMVLLTIGVSLLFTALYLTIAFIIFKKKDRH